jgi:hypothetical protein
MERGMRTIFNAARSALEQAQLDPEFCAEAVSDAIQKNNRIPKLQGDGTTVSFMNESADPSHLLPFGQHGRATNTVAGKTKLAPRSIHVRYLGAPNPHHHRVLIPATGKTVVVRAAEYRATPIPAYAAV